MFSLVFGRIKSGTWYIGVLIGKELDLVKEEEEVVEVERFLLLRFRFFFAIVQV